MSHQSRIRRLAWAITSLAVLAIPACGGDSDDGGGDLDPDLLVSLTLTNDGDGEGRVAYSYSTAAGAQNRDCLLTAGASGCGAEFEDAGLGGTLTVTATPSAGSTFAGWSGCNAVTGTACDLTFGSTPATLAATVTFDLEGELTFPTANLLVNPSFEVDDYRTGTSPVVPNATGFWKGDLGVILSGAQPDGIGPSNGQRIFRCNLSGPFGPSGQFTGCEAFQIVDVSAYATAIDAGELSATASVRVNRVQLDAQTDRQFGLTLYAIAGPPSSVPSALAGAAYLGTWQQLLTSDGDTGTWELVEVTSTTLPAGTRTVFMRLLAGEDVFNDADNTEFDGHYFDDASLRLTRP